MARKDNLYANRSQVNGKQVAVPFTSEQSAFQIAKDLDRLIRERDDISRKAVSFPKSVQAIAEEPCPKSQKKQGPVTTPKYVLSDPNHSASRKGYALTAHFSASSAASSVLFSAGSRVFNSS